ncbi:MAG: hypothetical protein A3E31_03080 [Candidatus Rokubacteria bacterium RIFCSPHIGHO2_12_FULL_73_22]|nr:MAG: hypothetical protein A3D33_16410 [Candidatus Rokubacteria bacterium RIFCSPHIGHO2_02_FULL_73_26]OGL03383.1 MAG: hypothetical protein A3E31_03080 [Candidatus Rokubacteria bacterium RIFCSPHIGHO2_12_FULL_73_22]OGL10078.1 MAG: hypothetical protein A3I14_14980 [Candidatus Rokubacteria bacterium RIFCSPLOWO2_02_FULL_73_56]OGL23784.1 MAG: hypothetical protein A3G44_19430 [Candidatus Rokubacteria bacterium RIFCSPLOWO2_12_FULL_73_47]
MRRPPAARAGAALLLVLLAGGLGPAAAQPTESDVFVAEGVLALEDKKYDEALAHFRRALEREPGHIEALYYSGVAHMGRGRPDAALPFLEKARAHSPGEVSVAFQLGLAYFALKRYDRAAPLLEEVFSGSPELDGLGYYVGFLRYRRQDYQGALRAFRTGRTTDPNLAQLTRLYTGLALAGLGLPEQAAAEVDQALRLQPASPLTGPAERLRESFAASRSRARRFHLGATLGVFFDDNVTARPNPEPNNRTVYELRRPGHTSVGELFSLDLGYDWLRRGAWDGTAGYAFFTTYNDELPSYNLMVHTGNASLARRGALAGMPLLSGAQYAYDLILLDDKEFVQRHATSLFGTLIESDGHLTNAQFRVEVKEFSEERPLVSEEFQDGVNWRLGLLHVVRFRQDRHFVRVGYQADLDDTRGENLDYFGHRVLAGASATLPWGGVRLSYDVSFHLRDYRHRHTLLPERAPGSLERRDRELTHQARVEVPLSRGFALIGDYLRTVNDSNIPSFEYERNVVTLSLSWQY